MEPPHSWDDSIIRGKVNELFVNTIILVLMNIIEYKLLNMFFRNYFDRKGKVFIEILNELVFVISFTYINLQHDFWKNAITGFTLVFITALVMYKGKLTKKFAFTIIFVAISSLSENFLTFVTSLLAMISITSIVQGFMTYAFSGFGGKIILFIILRYLIKQYPKYYELDKDQNAIMLSLFPAAAQISTYIILEFDSKLDISKTTHILTIGLLVIFLFLSVSIFFIYHSALHKNSLENQLKLGEEISIINQKLFHQQTASMKSIYAIQHEYKRHINNIVEYARQRRFDELEEYTAKFFEDANKYKLLMLIDFKNFTLSSLYGRLIQQCEEYGINLVTDIQYDNFKFISDLDANIIFGNLFDNALEACNNVSKNLKWIKLSILHMNNFAILTLSNTKTNEICFASNNSVPLSTKRNYQSEGYGIKNISDALNKYNGHLSISHKDDEFSIIIRMEIERPKDM